MPSVADYRLTVARKRGLLIRPLPWPPSPPPRDDESLMGLFARTCARNGFERPSRVLLLSDIDTLTPQSLPTVHLDAAERVAFVLGVPEDEVSRRMHRAVELDSRAEFLDFFGVPVRKAYREPLRRRTSPRALRISPHHRAVHELRPFVFCPETMERLIHACPVCGKTLGWRKTVGVEFCEHCVDEDEQPTTDLRDFPQPLVEVADEAALKLVTELVQPDLERRQTAMRQVPGSLGETGPGDLFELAVALSTVTRMDPRHVGASRSGCRSRDDFEKFTPESLARAGRIMMNWPAGFHELAEEMRASAGGRNAHYGMKRELGPLRTLARDPYLSSAMRTILTETIAENMRITARQGTVTARRRDLRYRDDLITSDEAATRLGVFRAAVRRLATRDDLTVIRAETARKAPALFLSEEIDAVAAVKRDLVTLVRAGNRLGLTPDGLRGLARDGLVQFGAGPALAVMPGKEYVRASSVEELLAAIEARALPGTLPAEFMRLDKAVRRLGPGEKPFRAIIPALLDGSLPVHVQGGRSVPLPRRFWVREADLRGAAKRSDETESRDEWVNYVDAAQFLSSNEVVVTALVREGLLPAREANGRKLAKAQLRAFAETFAFTPEVARSMRLRNSQVRSELGKLGIAPVASLAGERRLLWRRSDLPAGPEAQASEQATPGEIELSPKDAAAILGVSRPTVINRMKAGLLPFRWVGSDRRCKLGDVLLIKGSS